MTTTTVSRPDGGVGPLLRQWRERRRLTQLDLSIQSEVSTRHLSFVETGRSRPTAEMIVRLSEHLDVPLRERNTLLLAGGYAPAYAEHGLDAPELASVRAGLGQLLRAHEPNPAVLINRWWELQDSNTAIALFLDGCAAELVTPPVNVLRLSLHPNGMAPRIVNLGQWRSRVLTQLRRRADALADARLADLHTELSGYPGGDDRPSARSDVVLPLRYRYGQSELSFFSISSVIRTANDITVDGLDLEAFYPADASTAATLQSL